MSACDLTYVTQQNIAQILSKLNDASFSRSVQICRRLRDIAFLMDWKRSRIFCHAYFPIFAYFDEEENKVLFDAPIKVRKEMERWNQISRDGIGRSLTTHAYDYLLNPENWNDDEEEEEGTAEDESEGTPNTSSSTESSDSANSEQEQRARKEHEPRNCPDISVCKRRECKGLKEEQIFLMNESGEWLTSHLSFALSRRKHAYYRKMTKQELALILRIFRFKMVSIDPYLDEDHPPSEKLSLCADETLLLFPSIRAELFEIVGNNVPAHFDKIMSAAWENLNFSRLYIHNSELNGKILQIPEEIHGLSHFEAKVDKKNAKGVLANFIQRWKSGKTGLKQLRLEIEEDPTIQEALDPREIELEEFLRVENSQIFSTHSFHIPPLLSLFSGEYNNAKFLDVTDCEGCLCPTEFCTKKLLEFVTENTLILGWKGNVIDFGAVFEDWNGQNLQELGEKLKPYFE